MDAPFLFDFPPPPPTTRTIALAVKHGGSAALDQARRRADDARYQEVTCRSALNAVKGMPFNWTLNPYRGCTHACHYCFARRYQTQFELGPDDEFSSLIFVKINFPDVLRRELDKPGWTRELVALGTATDPYQPIEGHYKLTRRSLEALLASRTPVSVVTKGPMVVRDAHLLAELGRRVSCSVCLSVPTVDEEAWAALEPGTAHPMQRLRAVRELRKAGVNAGVLMAPIVPGFTTQRSRLEATIRAVAEHDAAFMGANVLHLKGGTKDHFMGFLRRQFPHLVEGYERLYPGAYAPKGYTAAVKSMIHALESRYELRRRAFQPPPETDGETAEAADVESGELEQSAFEWESRSPTGSCGCSNEAAPRTHRGSTSLERNGTDVTQQA
jgi:DNA repair photolyase